MFWKESMSEGVMSGLLDLAGRRRGLEAAEDILAERDRDDVPIDGGSERAVRSSPIAVAVPEVVARGQLLMYCGACVCVPVSCIAECFLRRRGFGSGCRRYWRPSGHVAVCRRADDVR